MLMPKRMGRTARLALLLGMVPVLLGAPKSCWTERQDGLQTTNTGGIAMSGTVWDDLDGNGFWSQNEPALSGVEVEVRNAVDGSTFSRTVTTDADGAFSTTVESAQGLNTFTVHRGGAQINVPPMFRTVETGLRNFPSDAQEVCITYNADAEDAIVRWRDTVDLSGYAWWYELIVILGWEEAVKQETRSATQRYFDGYGVVVLEGCSPGGEIQGINTIFDCPDADSNGQCGSGEAVVNYKNTDKDGHLDVFLQSYDLGLGTGEPLFALPPLAPSDSPSVRIQDIARAVGSTMAHETGHALGLVKQDELQGNARSHNKHDAPTSVIRAAPRLLMNDIVVMDAILEFVRSPGGGRLPERRSQQWNFLNGNYLEVVTGQ